jgi:hypothetical protein
MEINIDDFRNRDDFVVKENDEFILIHSSQSKDKWKVDELKYRSIMCDKEGNVVSSGFPKFFNYGDYPPNDKLLMDHIANATTRLDAIGKELKHDGTNIIRSVINGKVHWRTRNNFSIIPLGTDNDCYDYKGLLEYIKTMPHACYRYPGYAPDTSILFEWISPDNKLIVKYKTPKLKYLGEVNLDDLSFTVGVDAEDYIPEPIRGIYPTLTSFKEAIDSVKGEKDIEGYVLNIWCRERNSHVLFKVKTDWYYKLFGIKYMLNQKKFNQLCWLNGLLDYTDILDYFGTLLGSAEDLEAVSEQLNDMYSVYDEDVYYVERELEDFFSINKDIIQDYVSIAEKIKQLKRNYDVKSNEFNLGIYILRDKEENSHQRVNDYIGSKICDMSITQYRNLVKETQDAHPVELDMRFFNE